MYLVATLLCGALLGHLKGMLALGNIECRVTEYLSNCINFYWLLDFYIRGGQGQQPVCSSPTPRVAGAPVCGGSKLPVDGGCSLQKEAALQWSPLSSPLPAPMQRQQGRECVCEVDTKPISQSFYGL